MGTTEVKREKNGHLHSNKEDTMANEPQATHLSERPARVWSVYLLKDVWEEKKTWQASKRRNIKQKQMAVLLSTTENPQTLKPNPQPSSQCSGTVCDIINEVESTGNQSPITRV